MSNSLYFLGIRKSTLKKKFPFNVYFRLRDRKYYQALMQNVQSKAKLVRGNKLEWNVSHRENGKELKLIARDFPSSDLGVFNQVFLAHCYFPIVEKMVREMNSTAGIKILDAGANVGFSVLFFKSYFPNAEIVAVEPASGNIAQIEKNLSANNLSVSKLVKGALWHKRSNLKVVSDFRDNTEAAFTVEETDEPEGILGTGIDELFAEAGWERADLIKIDIEGGERFMFDTKEKSRCYIKSYKIPCDRDTRRI